MVKNKLVKELYVKIKLMNVCHCVYKKQEKCQKLLDTPPRLFPNDNQLNIWYNIRKGQSQMVKEASAKLA